MKFYLLFASLALTGCAANPSHIQDPFESLNRKIYQFNEVADKAVLKPVAKSYNAVMPTFAKLMVTNFFSNLEDVVTTANDLLQFKFAQAASDGSRVLFNSTFGVFGLFNVADRLEKHREDFGQTLGFWGVSNGPYIVLPFFGPSALRDSVGLYVDTISNPGNHIQDISVRNQLYVLDKINLRARLIAQEKLLDTAALDRYSFLRDAYLQRRISQVHDGNPPRVKFEDEDF
jgi:phospholipid-binding lipoprotein MlaA